MQAEKLNGRAAMVGYAMAWIVDGLSGAGLQDQQNSFLGKLLLHVAVFAILIFRYVTSSSSSLKAKHELLPRSSVILCRDTPGCESEFKAQAFSDRGKGSRTVCCTFKVVPLKCLWLRRHLHEQ